MEILGVLTYILVMFSPFILMYGLLNMKYELLDDRLLIKFFGLKSREIFYNDIHFILPLEQFPFIKNPFWQNIAFNKVISIELKKENFSKKPSFSSIYFTKKTIIAPKNRDEFLLEFENKLKNFKIS
jgi:hypothetical protein